MLPSRRHDNQMLGFLALSLLLHLLLALLLPRFGLVPATDRQPVYVEVVPPRPQQLRERELDLPPAPDTPRDRPARRLGPSDRQVERETAPKGDAPDDRTPALARPALPSSPAAAAPAAGPRAPAGATGPAPSERGIRPAAPPGTEAPKRLPGKEALLAAATQAAQGVAEQQIAEWRRKYRGDVEQGDAVWLDTERDLLISFFRRFRDNIYAVWNYPRDAAERGEEGTCLLRITINRDGTVGEIDLQESSGYPLLDREAQAAVRKGAPYGALPRSYEGDSLTIFAFFQYKLGQRYLLGG